MVKSRLEVRFKFDNISLFDTELANEVSYSRIVAIYWSLDPLKRSIWLNLRTSVADT